MSTVQSLWQLKDYGINNLINWIQTVILGTNREIEGKGYRIKNIKINSSVE